MGGGPVGLRLAIELKLGGHQAGASERKNSDVCTSDLGSAKVTVFEKRREVRDETGQLQQLGFTNRILVEHPASLPCPQANPEARTQVCVACPSRGMC